MPYLKELKPCENGGVEDKSHAFIPGEGEPFLAVYYKDLNRKDSDKSLFYVNEHNDRSFSGLLLRDLDIDHYAKIENSNCYLSPEATKEESEKQVPFTTSIDNLIGLLMYYDHFMEEKINEDLNKPTERIGVQLDYSNAKHGNINDPKPFSSGYYKEN